TEVTDLHGQPNFESTVEAMLPVIRSHAFQMHFLGCNLFPVIELRDPGLSKHHFHTSYNHGEGKNCLEYESILYHDLYPNIDLRIYSNDFFLKYDFIVHPGGDPLQIKWSYDGVLSPTLENGQLIIDNTVTAITEQHPISFQINQFGQRQLVKSDFYTEEGIFSFDLPEGYDPSRSLIIDPELIFSTYSGSFSDNFGYTATYDNEGNLYSGSSAFGNQYPTTLGAFQSEWAGGDGSGNLPGTDIVISKYTSDGTSMVWSSYLGGSSDELPHSLVVNNSNELVVLGTSSSPDFPTTVNAYDTEFGGGSSFAPSGVGVDYANGSDIVVAKFSEDGSSLIGSTFMGGSDNDGINQSANLKFNYADEMRGEVEIDGQGNICVVSCTFSDDFPVQGAFQASIGGALDGCVFKMSPDLNSLLWSSFLGGSEDDAAYALVVENDDELVVCGGTESDGFLSSLGYQDQNNGGESDGFIVRLNVTSGITRATYLGSPWYDQTYFVEKDSQGNIYTYGQTRAQDSYFINNAQYGQANSG
ncbi:MAG: PKD domain-containing protein, partial [Flavobacteriales bacterium]|nr:PKD domain-containing protein [Flavobacteriales bacterium]